MNLLSVSSRFLNFFWWLARCLLFIIDVVGFGFRDVAFLLYIRFLYWNIMEIDGYTYAGLKLGGHVDMVRITRRNARVRCMYVHMYQESLVQDSAFAFCIA
jgi:hypothetical protein